VIDKALIITYIDHILRNAIESSPPVKVANKSIMRYDQHLKKSFLFGTSDKYDDDEEELYNIEAGGKSVLEKSESTSL
jgi:hypothetical protein